MGDDHIGLKAQEFRRVSLHLNGVTRSKTVDDLKIAALVPSPRLKRSAKLFNAVSSHIVLRQTCYTAERLT